MHDFLHNVMIKTLLPERIKLFEKIKSRQNWSLDQINNYQEVKLKEMLQYCWRNVPFYQRHWQNAGVDPLSIKHIEELVQLPVLTKENVKNNLQALTTNDSKIKFTEARTGGSTGRPIVFRMTHFDEQMAWAQMYMGWHWAGYNVGAPFLVVGGESVGSGLGDKRTWKDKIINRWTTSGSNLTRERALHLAQSSHFNKVSLIYGYPNAIKELGEFLQSIGKLPKSLKGIVCTAEVMRKEVRDRIEAIFGVKVLDQYGLNDGGLHACESFEQDGLNLSFHRSVLEIIDENGKQITAAKQPGKAIASCFTNFAMPFIRYETGDNVHWHGSTEKAGQTNWQKLGPIDGRTGDIIKLPSGRIITMPGLTLVMRWIDGIKQYQFIQTDLTKVTVRLLLYPNFPLDVTAIKEYLNKKITDEIEWTIIEGEPKKTKNDKVLIIQNDYLRSQAAD